MKILIVDDDVPILNICRRTLEKEGHAVSTAASGEEAANRLGEPWDIILTDFHMPGTVNGLTLLQRAKEMGNADVLMMTGYPELDLAINALKLGAYDFIIKPFTPDAIRLAVQRCVDKRNLSLELARERALRVELDQAHSELVRMQKVKETFGLFVTPEVANYVLSLPDAEHKRGIHKRVTILFSDVRNFTSFCSGVSPEEAVDTLNEIFSCIITNIQKEGGTLNKFMGDGLLAIFGAPIDLKNHEEAAAEAAISAMAAVEQLVIKKKSQGRSLPHIGIAINTGEVIAGCLGTQDRTEYSIIGHAVNLTARLNGAARPGQILLGPDTAKALGDRFRREALAPVSLSGIQVPISVWELVGKKAY